MTIRPDLLLAHPFEEQHQSYDARDAILYALGVGMGRESEDLVYLDETRLQVLPTFAITLASPGMWIRDPRFGITFAKLVHAAQDCTFPNSMPPAGTVVGSTRLASIGDRGEGRGAELLLERQIRGRCGALYATVRQTLLLLGDGGFGGEPPNRVHPVIPDRPCDLHANVQLSSRAALIYRLSGDRNPLHIDPDFARVAGFDRPIMHGLGSYAAAGAAVARAVGSSPTSIARLGCRLSGVVFPGDALQLSIWREPNQTFFVAHANGRKVLDDGILEVRH